MFCPSCGTKNADGSAFCIGCGNPLPKDVVTPVTIEQPADAVSLSDEKRNSAGSSVLTFAILGLAFGCSGYGSLFGLIFAIISRVKLSRYLARYETTRGPATVGKHLGLAGLIVSIVWVVVFVVYILLYCLIILLALSSSAPGGGYYY